MAGAMLSDSWLRWTAPVLGTGLGLMFRSHVHDQFSSDVMVEADAEVAFDARPVLPRIEVPVLLIGGDKDSYFPAPLIEETASLIPDCTLRVYEGKGHIGACTSRRIPPDILEFIEQNQRAS
jgi:pimeloyl-ACP methyl ester carboxylesterase